MNKNKHRRFCIYYRAMTPVPGWKLGIETDSLELALEFVQENLRYFRLQVLDRQERFCFNVLRPDELAQPNQLRGE